MMPTSLTVETTAHAGGIRVTVRGELDIATATRLEEALRRAEAERPEKIVIDLSALDFMDSTGLRSIVSADGRARDAGRRLVLVRGSEMVQRVLRVTRLDERLEIVEPPAAAGV